MLQPRLCRCIFPLSAYACGVTTTFRFAQPFGSTTPQGSFRLSTASCVCPPCSVSKRAPIYKRGGEQSSTKSKPAARAMGQTALSLIATVNARALHRSMNFVIASSSATDAASCIRRASIAASALATVIHSVSGTSSAGWEVQTDAAGVPHRAVQCSCYCIVCLWSIGIMLSGVGGR